MIDTSPDTNAVGVRPREVVFTFDAVVSETPRGGVSAGVGTGATGLAGVTLVSASGRQLDEIVAQVGQMSEAVSRIAAGAKEQAISLREVSTAADQMDKVTQQNAAMVEESTAASHSLAQEAEKLTSLVGQFRTGQESAAAPSGLGRRQAAPSRAAARPISRGNTALAHKPEAAEDGWEEF